MRRLVMCLIMISVSSWSCSDREPVGVKVYKEPKPVMLENGIIIEDLRWLPDNSYEVTKGGGMKIVGTDDEAMLASPQMPNQDCYGGRRTTDCAIVWVGIGGDPLDPNTNTYCWHRYTQFVRLGTEGRGPEDDYIEIKMAFVTDGQYNLAPDVESVFGDIYVGLGYGYWDAQWAAHRMSTAVQSSSRWDYWPYNLQEPTFISPQKWDFTHDGSYSEGCYMVRLERLEPEYMYQHTSAGSDLRYHSDGKIRVTGFGARVPLRDIPPLHHNSTPNEEWPELDATTDGMAVGIIMHYEKFEPATPYCAEYICADTIAATGYRASYHNADPDNPGQYIPPWPCDSIMCVTWEPTGEDTCYYSKYPNGSARYQGGWQTVTFPGTAFLVAHYDSLDNFDGYHTTWPHQWGVGYPVRTGEPIGYFKKGDPTSRWLPYRKVVFRDNPVHEAFPFNQFNFPFPYEVPDGKNHNPTEEDTGPEGLPTPTPPRWPGR